MNIKNTTIFLCLLCALFVFLFSQESKDYTSPTIGLLKYVPAGTFQRDNNPANTSTVSEFRMSQTEITEEQFARVMGQDLGDTNSSIRKQKPVQNVSWYQALVFCNRLSILEGLEPVYRIGGSSDPTVWGAIPNDDNTTWSAVVANWSAEGYRLPTEMEWMWAAMGAVNTTTGYKKAFAGSNGTNAIDEYAWYKKNSNKTTHFVGTRLPNEIDLYDMSGNVSEWCWDWLGYSTGSDIDYKGVSSGVIRVLRGGSYLNNINSLSVVVRDYFVFPYSQKCDVGFRVVRK